MVILSSALSLAKGPTKSVDEDDGCPLRARADWGFVSQLAAAQVSVNEDDWVSGLCSLCRGGAASLQQGFQHSAASSAKCHFIDPV